LKSRFWNGLIAGSVIGAVLAWFVTPEMKPDNTRRMMMGQSRRMNNRARGLMRRMRDGMSDMMDD